MECACINFFLRHKQFAGWKCRFSARKILQRFYTMSFSPCDFVMKCRWLWAAVVARIRSLVIITLLQDISSRKWCSSSDTHKVFVNRLRMEWAASVSLEMNPTKYLEQNHLTHFTLQFIYEFYTIDALINLHLCKFLLPILIYLLFHMFWYLRFDV